MEKPEEYATTIPSGEAAPDLGDTEPASPMDVADPDATASVAAPWTDPAVGLPPCIGRYCVRALLGRGGFGRVYLVYDAQLQREVAVKVPHRQLVPGPEEAESYLAEARAAAHLDHPHIVPVYDVGSTPEFPCFIVTKYIQGPTLARRLQAREDWPSVAEAVRLVTSVAEALHHAHLRGIVHRDVKPGNILLDADGRPYVADFGLALRESEFGTGPKWTGTPAYMSPEQARGEGHRVDGRSDVFSLGVVLYELLTRRRPFVAPSTRETLRLVADAEIRTPRELDAAIHGELERICLKALARRASERYASAGDLADDLRHFLASDDRNGPPPATRKEVGPGASAAGPGVDSAAEPQSVLRSLGPTVRVIPRGLRSFDASDAEFFLGLLPGPRDRGGLPESLRFWKAGIEETDPQETFPVGLLYGPSGCGKSSLVKAGLVPRLADHVLPIYLEATADGTEHRLKAALARRCPGPARPEGLAATLAWLRRGESLPAGRKVLIVLDQFEQWLHARSGAQHGELVEALRQCDGGRVQCLVLVRDDFWMAATRFMGELEVPLVEGRNSAAVDLFPVRHAERVLEAFGRAFDALPERPAMLTREQRHFVDQAVAGLAQEGKVICVRLALFAQMMKDRPWTPASLRGVGGALGVGATFLEETFSAPGAPPEHRRHQEAARAILKGLLPGSGTDIKGHMRSEDELLALSGYAGRPRDFEDLLHILDGELRLITPTDPSGAAGGGWRVEGTDRSDPASPHAPPSTRYYQLTHDYLVPSLRDWLTRKLRETRRGRAELRLAERSDLWSARPETRFLPAWWEWLALRLLTRRRDWTTAQRAMMRRAARHHAAWGLALAAGLVLALLAAAEGYGRHRAQLLRDRLLEAATEDVPRVVGQMAPYRRWLDEPLRRAYAEASAALDARRQLHASLGLLPVDRGQFGYLYQRLLTAGPQEVLVIREALRADVSEAVTRLWRVLEDAKRLPSERLRAACALAAYTPEDPRWERLGRDVAERLAAENGLGIGRWAEALRPVRRHLLPRLATLLIEEGLDAASRRTITGLYGDYARGLPEAFAGLEKAADEGPPSSSGEERVAQSRRRANAAAALASLGRWEAAQRLLVQTREPTARSYLIDRLGPGGSEALALEDLIFGGEEDSARRAAVLALGEFDDDRLPPAEREEMAPRLAALYRDELDPGMHSAIGWLLRRWGQGSRLEETARARAGEGPEGDRRWYLNSQGQTMVLLPPGEYQRGSKGQVRRRVDRRFALADREVTVADFRRFRPDFRIKESFAASDDCPVHEVSWYDAAAYCNWLSEQAGIPKDQWCYLPNEQGKYASGMKIAPDATSRTGYRLPTADEWEYACRAGSVRPWSLGEAQDLLTKYAWHLTNSWSRLHPVGELRPNDWGFFDIHGNAWEWCHDGGSGRAAGGTAVVISDAGRRLMRGGGFGHDPLTIQAANDQEMVPGDRGGDMGLRPARTLP